MSAKTATAANQKFSYDEVPYLSFPYPHTHPSHLAMVASLFGMTPPAIATARVLELGCASGGNIFPLALRYPGAKFTGLDLSQEQVAMANVQKDAMGVKNATFMQQDILAFDLKKNKAAFDYIICHGVYSWVPEEVSDRILEICRECLSENGLAIVSYNTLPGWNAVRSIRDMMRFHCDRFVNAKEKTAQARKLLQFLSETAREGSGYKSVIEEEMKHLSKLNDSYLYHDHLEGINRQFYFHQFIGSLNKHSLGYVGDCALTTMFVENMAPKAMEALKVLNDLGMQEQYMDFVTNRRFRSSIICHKAVSLKRDMKHTKIMNYHLTTNMQPEEANPDFKKPVKFVSKSGTGNFTAKNEATAVIYSEISKSGARPVSAKDVVAKVQKQLKHFKPEDVEAALVQNGLQLALRGFLTLHMDTPAYVDKVSAKPVAGVLARYQASISGCNTVTNALCSTVPIGTVACIIIPLLDGTRTLAEVTAVLEKHAADGKITVREKEQPIKDKAAIAAKLKETVTTIVDQLAKQALLQA